MDTIVIMCLVAGIACIGASFILKDSTGVDNQEKEKIAEELRKKVLSEESIRTIMNKVEKDFTAKLSDIADDRVVESTDRLSETANNKMIAINDMGGQLIEKIEQNHKEVIFLYDMLNEKSDNLKDFSAKIDGLRKELESEEKRIKALNNDIDDKIVRVREVRQTVIAKPQSLPSQEKAGTAPAGTEQTGTVAVHTAQGHKEERTQAGSLVKMKMEQQAEKQALQENLTKEEQNLPENTFTMPEEAVNEPQIPDKKEPVQELSVNDKILQMKEEGKSIIEISKELGMGQGEVQLILGLFGK